MGLGVVKFECVTYAFISRGYRVDDKRVDPCYECQNGIEGVICPFGKHLIQKVTRLEENLGSESRAS